MPVVVEPDQSRLEKLLTALPPGGHGVESVERLHAWLGHRKDEYAVVFGPGVDFDAAMGAAEKLRITVPGASAVLIRESIDTTVLTRAMQAGVRDVVPVDDEVSLETAVTRAQQFWTALRGPDAATRMGKVFTVFSPKGGVGKTTTSVNLALALADDGARQVCLVDLDLAFGDVAITLQLFPSHSIEHAVGSEEAMEMSVVETLLTRHESSLMVLAAPSLPDARDRVTPALVSRMLRTLQEQFDYVVVDTAPAFDEQTLTALDETDECVIVATLDVPTLKNVKVALDTLDMLDIARGHRHLLLNRADDAVGLGPDKVEAILGMSITTSVASSMDVAAATNSGKPIMLSNPDHPSSRAVRRLAAHLAGEQPGEDESGEDKKSRFRKRK